jgi:hypothetical protein
VFFKKKNARGVHNAKWNINIRNFYVILTHEDILFALFLVLRLNVVMAKCFKMTLNELITEKKNPVDDDVDWFMSTQTFLFVFLANILIEKLKK